MDNPSETSISWGRGRIICVTLHRSTTTIDVCYRLNTFIFAMENLWLDLYRNVHHYAETTFFHTCCMGKVAIIYLTHTRAYKGLIWSPYYLVLLLPPSNFQDSWTVNFGGRKHCLLCRTRNENFLARSKFDKSFPTRHKQSAKRFQQRDCGKCTNLHTSHSLYMNFIQ